MTLRPGRSGRLKVRTTRLSTTRFATVTLPKEAVRLLEERASSAARASLRSAADRTGAAGELSDEDVRRLNRHVIDSCYPREMIGSLAVKRDYAIDGFVQGLGVGTKGIKFSQIPWYAWTRTLFGFWLPLMLVFSFAMIGLALVVHRQWSDHERLPYPIVTFARSLLPEEGRSRGSVFTERLFWLGTCAILFIHLNNYAHRWWPQQLVQIPTHFDFRSLAPLFPTFRRGGTWALLDPRIHFTAIGFAYFVATDVSLSLGIAAFIYAWVAGVFAGFGVSLGGGGFFSTRIYDCLHAGAYFGMFVFLMYTGRHYYLTVLRRSLFLRAKDEVEPSAVWGARVFMVCTTLFILWLCWRTGLAWHWAVLYTAAAVMLYVSMSRVVAETGMFFIHSYWWPSVLLWVFFGPKTIGPHMMLIMFLTCCVVMIDTREGVMPFMVHALKLVEASKARLGRTALWGGVAIAVGIAAGLPVVLYLQYKHGSGAVGDFWNVEWVPRFSYNAIVRVNEKLAAQDVLSEAGQYSGLAWLKSISPVKPAVIGFCTTAVLVRLFAAARLRFPRWPFHPVMFLALGSFQCRTLAWSFLIGWFIKMAVTKYGGASVYRRLRPLMIGVIAGDLLGGITPMVIGAIYYFATGKIPMGFGVLPK
jgi:hypothetical protein